MRIIWFCITFSLLIIGCSASEHTNSDISAADNGSTPPTAPTTNETNDSLPDASSTNQTSDKADAGSPNEEIDSGCQTNSDCVSGFCRYDHVCITAPSCVNHWGGDTCGFKEVGEDNTTHESCCRSLPVAGFNDPAHPGKTVYLDKYEITAGRIHTFIESITKEMGGKPNIREWMANHRPPIWDPSWEAFLPTDEESGVITINRLLLGDPRHLGESNPPPGVIVPPDTDQTISVGLNSQFGGQIYADVHGNNCGTYNGSYGFPTYYYPPAVMIKNGEVPRSNALGYKGETIPAQEWLAVKSMNCITNVMLQAFCVWDTNGEGQLATSEVMDFIVDSPLRAENISGCGSQSDNHEYLLGNNFTGTVQIGGRCPAVALLNATFDAGDVLPVVGSPLNKHVYHYPDLSDSTSDKSWQIAAPGRNTSDTVYLPGVAEGWADLAGNLNEQVLATSNGVFTGRFGVKHRGIGYGSMRSDLNVTLMPGETILRVQRPEMKSALSGGRCQRFK